MHKRERVHKLIFVLILTFLPILTGCQSDVSKNTPVEEEATAPKVDLRRAAWYNIKLGIAYLEQGQMARAKSKLLHAEQLAPKMPAVHYALGMYYAQIQEYEAAEVAYRKSIALDKESGEAHNNFGAFLCKLGRYEEAEVEFLKALADRNYPHTADALENLGLCSRAAGNKEAARHYFERAVKQDPNRMQATLELGILALEANDVPAAKQWLALHKAHGQSSDRSLWLEERLIQATDGAFHPLDSAPQPLITNRFLEEALP